MMGYGRAGKAGPPGDFIYIETVLLEMGGAGGLPAFKGFLCQYLYDGQTHLIAQGNEQRHTGMKSFL